MLDESKIAYDGLHDIACAIRSLKRSTGRMVFAFGIATEQNQPVTKTPHLQSPITGAVLVMKKITNSQNLPLSVKFIDKKGQPANVDGVPQWSVTNSELLALTVSEDGLSAVVGGVAPLGTAGVTVQADADLGDGVVPVIGTFEVEVTGGQAAVVAIEAGEPVEQE